MRNLRQVQAMKGKGRKENQTKKSQRTHVEEKPAKKLHQDEVHEAHAGQKPCS